MILDARCQVLGADQSSGMLEVTRVKHPEVPTEKVGLQELAFTSAFDAAICMDAMDPEREPRHHVCGDGAFDLEDLRR